MYGAHFDGIQRRKQLSADATSTQGSPAATPGADASRNWIERTRERAVMDATGLHSARAARASCGAAEEGSDCPCCCCWCCGGSGRGACGGGACC